MRSRHQSYLDSLPRDWSKRSISDVGEIVSGGTPSRANPAYWGGDICWVTPGELTDLGSKDIQATNDLITPAGLANSAATLLPKGALLVTSRATIGSVALAGVPMATNQGFKAVVFRNHAKPDFYYHLFKTLTSEMVRRSSGTTFLEISLREFAEILVPYPEPFEQRRIAEILDTADEAIRRTEQVIAKLKLIKQGLLHDLLTRGIDENGELRDPVRHPNQFKDSPLGKIPKAWDVVTISDIAIQVTDGDHITPKRAESGMYLISARNILDGSLTLDDVDFVPEYEYRRMITRCHPEEGDILISCSGTVGRVCAVPKGLTCVLVRSAALVKLDVQMCTSRFCEWALRSNSVRVQILGTQHQSAQPNLFQSSIRKLAIAKPPLSEQNRIAEAMDKIGNRINDEEKRLSKLKAVKRGLMDDLLSGRMRVKVDKKCS